jgi:hypothetical protein
MFYSRFIPDKLATIVFYIAIQKLGLLFSVKWKEIRKSWSVSSKQFLISEITATFKMNFQYEPFLPTIRDGSNGFFGIRKLSLAPIFYLGFSLLFGRFSLFFKKFIVTPKSTGLGLFPCCGYP